MSLQPAAAVALPEPLDAALARVRSALTRLQAAAERQADERESRGDHDQELALLLDDRARLATDLDGARERVEALRKAQAEALTRLAKAEAAVSVALRDLLTDEAPGAEVESAA